MSEDALLNAPAEDPLVGMVLQERYRIIRKIGEGGMGAVYEGEHVLIKRRVAIKCLHAQLAQNPEIVARFHREALAATSIGHEHIVEVTDMGRFPDGAVFMVLEFLEGRDWGHELDEHGPQPLGKVVHVISQVAEALQAAHDKGIIHRDLKPENVFLIKRGADPDFVKVLDFGISKFKDAAEGASKGMTKTGTTMGTPYYMAPEQAQGKKDIDHRADIYSLGVMIFQALTGQYPFDDESYPMLVLKICTEAPPPVRMFRQDVPEEVERIVFQLLAKNPEERFPNCASVKAALAPYREVQSAPVVAENAPSTATMQSSALSGARTPGGSPATPAAHGAQTPQPGETGAYAVPGISRLVLVGIAALTVLVIGGGLGIAAALGLFGGGGAQPEVSEEGTPTPSSAQPALAAPATLVAQPGQQSVRVQIRTEPKNAELYLDGHRIPNPFDGDLRKTTEPHRLEAKLEGYEDEVQELSLHIPQRVSLELEALGKEPPSEDETDRAPRERRRVRRPARAGGEKPVDTRADAPERRATSGTPRTREPATAPGGSTGASAGVTTSGSGASGAASADAEDEPPSGGAKTGLKRIGL